MTKNSGTALDINGATVQDKDDGDGQLVTETHKLQSPERKTQTRTITGRVSRRDTIARRREWEWTRH